MTDCMTRMSPSQQLTQSPPFGPVDPLILARAVDAVFDRTRGLHQRSIRPHAERERAKRRGWDALHDGQITVEHVATILMAWAETEISALGTKGRPDKATLYAWAAGINETLTRAREVLAR